MAKKTWVNIGGSWHNVKAAWLNVAGVWKKITPKGNIAGVWKEFIQYALKVYDYGVENIKIVEGYRNGNRGTITKNSDHIRLYVSNQSSQDDIGMETETMIDVTPYKSIKMIYDLSSTAGTGNLCFKIDTNKASSQNSYVARNLLNVVGSNLETSIDVSEMSGEFYIQAIALASNYNFTEAKIYAIWLE